MNHIDVINTLLGIFAILSLVFAITVLILFGIKVIFNLICDIF